MRERRWSYAPSIAFVLGLSTLLGAGAARVLAADDRRLVEAAKRQDVPAAVALIEQGINVNARDADGATALHWAAHRDLTVLAGHLLRAGAAANVESDLGVTPLALAASNGSAAMVDLLLRAGATVNPEPLLREPPLMMAARAGVVDAVQRLLDAGAAVNAAEPSERQTALMWAISERHQAVVQRLLGRGADVHARSRRGSSPLLFASRVGNLEAVRLLIAAGASANDATPDGMTALLLATVRGHVDVAMELLAHGADPNAIGPGFTALHWAAGSWETEMTGPNGIDTDADEEWRGLAGIRTGKLDLVTALLDHGADPNAEVTRIPPRVGYSQLQVEHRVAGVSPFMGATPFLLAAMAADVPVMRLLAARGGDPRRTSRDKTTALMVAAGLGRYLPESHVTPARALQAVKLARELGIDVNARNDAGNTALHGAAFIKADAVVQYLVDAGAALDVRNARDQTPETLGDTIRGGSATIRSRTATGDLLRQLAARRLAR